MPSTHSSEKCCTEFGNRQRGTVTGREGAGRPTVVGDGLVVVAAKVGETVPTHRRSATRLVQPCTEIYVVRPATVISHCVPRERGGVRGAESEGGERGRVRRWRKGWREGRSQRGGVRRLEREGRSQRLEHGQ